MIKKDSPIPFLVSQTFVFYLSGLQKYHAVFVIEDLYSILEDGANLTRYPRQNRASDPSLEAVSLLYWTDGFWGIQHEIGSMDPTACAAAAPLWCKVGPYMSLKESSS